MAVSPSAVSACGDAPELKKSSIMPAWPASRVVYGFALSTRHIYTYAIDNGSVCMYKPRLASLVQRRPTPTWLRVHDAVAVLVQHLHEPLPVAVTGLARVCSGAPSVRELNNNVFVRVRPPRRNRNGGCG